METLKLIRKAKLFDDGTVYGEWYPANEGIGHITMHGMTLPLSGTVSQTLDAYENTARQAILAVVQQEYPGMYE